MNSHSKDNTNLTLSETPHRTATPPSFATTPFGIRNRILIFALIVTLVPSLGSGYFFYIQTKQILQEKTELALHTTVNQTQQDIELWIKERAVNLKVFSNSFLLSENLEHINNTVLPAAEGQNTTAVEVIREYLALVASQFPEYKRLLVFDSHGNNGIGQSLEEIPFLEETPFLLPDNWQKQLEQNKNILGQTEDTTLIIATPIFSSKQVFLGMLAAELTINTLRSTIYAVSLPQATHLSLIDAHGSTLISTLDGNSPKNTTPLDKNILKTLQNTPVQLSTYMNCNNSKVVGILKTLPHLSWALLIEKNYDQVFAEILKLKNIIFAVIALLVTLVGISAILVSRSILSPLRLLINGSLKVAHGDLNIQLPVKKRDELGVAMAVFNDMVSRLRKSHNTLEKLLTVDPLTGLSNRKHLMEMLATHIKRYDRQMTPFSILMADLDHFKQVNDRYGHLAGDAVLIKIGEIFKEMLRSIDTAGRYGGEEFLIILDNTGEREALQTAERIRKTVAESQIHINDQTLQVSLSIGVATITNMMDTKNNRLIAKADKALYQAKQDGRNRVVLFPSITDTPLLTL